MKKLLVSALVLCLVLLSCDNTPLNTEAPGIIPLPNNIEMGRGDFSLTAQTKIIYTDEAFKDAAIFYQQAVKKEIGLDLQVEQNSSAQNNAINLVKDATLGEEAYVLDVQKKQVINSSNDYGGAVYGMQSLLQMVRNQGGEQLIAAMKLSDKPAQSWRGYMLDESRHFFGKETVLQYLDVLGRLKFNRFHWHLTDEQAWRIEIKRYPRLTEVGSSGSWSDADAPSFFYTQEDIKEIVAYAAKLNISVIPEIDMPGHATAVSRAYPEISGGGKGKWNGFTFHPAKETTYEFIDNVLTEIAELFPAPYIHIGGDEVHYGNQSWYTDSVIQKFIKDNDLKNEVGLEHYFVRRATEIVNKKGKTMIGWDEILNAGITPDQAVVMWWRHDKPELLKEALDKGFQVLLTPRIPCYFDFVQHDSQKVGRRWAGAYNELHTVYAFPEGIKDIITGHETQIMGLQANMWTERIKDKKRLDYMTYPRVLAIAEVGWTDAAKKDYTSFEARLKPFTNYLDALKIYYFNVFDPSTTPEPWGPDREDALANG